LHEIFVYGIVRDDLKFEWNSYVSLWCCKFMVQESSEDLFNINGLQLKHRQRVSVLHLNTFKNIKIYWLQFH
jgi:hypothetical protein